MVCAFRYSKSSFDLMGILLLDLGLHNGPSPVSRSSNVLPGMLGRFGFLESVDCMELEMQ